MTLKIIATYLVSFVIFLSLAFGVFVYSNIDTEYAPGYSEEIFSSINAGDYSNVILQRIGSPIEQIKTETEDIWIYSRQGKNKKANYYERFILFDKSGHVKKRKKPFI